jgi:hypothetical protein
MSQSWYMKQDLLERKKRLQLEKSSGAQKLVAPCSVKAGVFMDVLTLGWWGAVGGGSHWPWISWAFLGELV